MIQQVTGVTQVPNVTELRRQIKRLEQENEVLRHCWQDAQRRAEQSQKRNLTLINDISLKDGEIMALRREVETLSKMLTPEVA